MIAIFISVETATYICLRTPVPELIDQINSQARHLILFSWNCANEHPTQFWCWISLYCLDYRFVWASRSYVVYKLFCIALLTNFIYTGYFYQF
jgi:hypothetical protein